MMIFAITYLVCILYYGILSPLMIRQLLNFSKGGDMEFFELYKKTGALYSRQKFDYEKRRSYEIIIRATENCTCERQIGSNGTIVFCEDLNILRNSNYDSKNDLSRIKVKINILDINDNVPYFTRNSYKIGITPDVGYGDTILEGFVSYLFFKD